jgi:uncharacterized protein YgiM (DUF1202 family)
MTKLAINLSLALSIVALTVLPALAANQTFFLTQNVGPGNQGGGQTLYTCTRGTNGKVNMRRGAGIDYAIVLQIPNNKSINSIDTVNTEDGFIWHKVSYKGKVGWVRGDYLCD